MAYTGNTLSLTSVAPIEGGWKEWTYVTTDSLSTVKGAGYISDASNRGMEVGDFVKVVNTTTPAYAIYAVASISAGAATLATTAIVLT